MEGFARGGVIGQTGTSDMEGSRVGSGRGQVCIAGPGQCNGCGGPRMACVWVKQGMGSRCVGAG